MKRATPIDVTRRSCDLHEPHPYVRLAIAAPVSTSVKSFTGSNADCYFALGDAVQQRRDQSAERCGGVDDAGLMGAAVSRDVARSRGLQLLHDDSSRATTLKKVCQEWGGRQEK